MNQLFNDLSYSVDVTFVTSTVSAILITNPVLRQCVHWNSKWISPVLGESIIRECIQKFPDWVENDVYAYLLHFSFRCNTKGYGDKITRLTHKIAIELHLVAESLPFAVLAPGGQSGNFWIHHHIFLENNWTSVPDMCFPLGKLMIVQVM